MNSVNLQYSTQNESNQKKLLGNINKEMKRKEKKNSAVNILRL